MRKILAIVLSIAILVMAFPLSVFAVESTVATDTWDGTFSEPTTTDADGNILITSAEEMAWVALRGGEATTDKNYKVADGIESFDMNGATGITADSTAADVKDATATGNNWNYEADGKAGKFMGNFDGNGVTIYNIRTLKHGYAGLFPFVYNETTIENVIVKASYFAAYHNAAAIVGSGELQKTITVNKCAVENCYITDGGDTNPACTRAAAAFVAATGNSNLNINNCFAANNEYSAAGYEAGFVAVSGNYIPTGISITNSISIGMTPYSNAKLGGALGGGLTEKLTVSNVYTDVDCDVTGVNVLANEDMQGAAAKNNMVLAWNTDWVVGDEGEYPSIHYGAPIVDPYVWNGTFTEPTETDADGNVIINSAQEMAWVALRGDEATNGVNYKVADGIEYFDMNGAIGVTADSTAEDVKDAPSTGNNWNYAADNKAGKFMGNFDGNGVTIYNIRTQKFAYAGLFPFVYNETTIENVTVKASYFAAYHNAAAIVGTGELQKTITVNKCAVENCYITDGGDTNPVCQRAAAGVIAATGNSNAKISNCLVVNNIFSAAGYEAAFVAKTGNYIPSGIEITNSIAIGITPYSNAKIGELGTGLTEKLTAANVYSDVDCDVEGFTTLTTDKLQGAAAKNNMALAWGTDWVEGDEGEYPSVYYGEPIVDPYLWDGTFVEPTEVDSEGNIIINTASEMAWVALRGGEATEGKNYKVADGVKFFNMNGSVGVNSNSTAEVVKSAAATGSNWNYESDDRAGKFMGNFDGNGVTIYNIRTIKHGYSALFPFVYNESTIENVTVKASYFAGYHYAAGIVGTAELQKTININNCAVENCYLTDAGDTNAACKRAAAAFVGGTGNSNVNIDNCLAANNEYSAVGYEAGFVAVSGNYIPTGISITNSISIGMTPYSNAKIGELGTGLTEKLTVSNVYSDVDCGIAGFTTLAIDDMIGFKAANKMSALDQSIWLFVEDSYPQLAISHDIVDGACVDCGLVLAIDPCTNGHTLKAVAGIDATAYAEGLKAHDKCSLCGKTFIDNVEVSDNELVIPSLADIWDGSFVEPTETDEDGNIIIRTAEELAWVALRGGAATIGNKYKVVEGSVFNLNGMEGISAFSTVEDVKAVGQPKADSYNYNYAWRFETDSNGAAPFGGTFDGNGLVVYNLFTAKGRGAAGLFPVIKTDANSTVTIKNVTIAAAHIGGYHYAGGIIGFADAPNATTKLIIENCAVKNCFIYDNNDANPVCQRTTGTLAGGLGHNKTTISNCLVADNEISAQGIIGGLFGNTSAYSTGVTVSNVVSAGTEVQPMMVETAVNDKANETVYINVYTDRMASANGITILDTDAMKGSAAADNMNLNWNINWVVGAEGEYPSIVIADSFYDEWDGSFVEPTKTDADGNIIISTAEEMAWVALRGDEATKGNNYKVADGIKYFNMNGMVGITVDSSVEDVKNADKNEAFAWRFAADNDIGTFYGNFDGNGVKIYNIYTAAGRAYAGLFPVIKTESVGSVAIKNVAVFASYIGAYHSSGAIIGLANAVDSSASVLIDSCIVKNSFISDNADQNPACQRTAGVIAGQLTHNATTINNCLVIGNEVSAVGVIGGIFGNTSNYAQPSTVSNVISIGTYVESVSVEYPLSEKMANVVYTNVYTDQTSTLEGVKTLTIDEMSGENALSNTTLDWSGWFATTDLPELRAFHNVTSVDNGDGTHTDSCADCSVVGLTTEHSFKNGECVCGAEDTVYVMYGDANGDGKINGKDYALVLQSINGWEVTIDRAAADANGDGKVNGKDYALILQFINGWDVTLGK